MNVLVTGGAGFVGRYLCAELHDRGHEVTALSRDPDESVLPDGVETALGDVTAYDSIEGAFAGQDAVVNLVSLTPLFEPKGGNERHFEVHTGGTENCIRAAEEHGVDRYVQMSALGADPDGLTAYIRSKGEADRLVQNSDLDWVIVRPSVIFGDGSEFVSFPKRLKKMFAPLVPLYPLPGGGRNSFQPIHIDEMASILADCVEDEERGGDIYEIGGPEVLTLREITNMVYEAEGKSVSIVPLPMPLANVGLKTLGVVPGFPMGGDQYRSLKFENVPDVNDVTEFGIDTSEMTTLREYLGV